MVFSYMHTAVDIVVHFYGTMIFSEHKRNCQLSYPDNSGCHYINMYFKWQTFATYSVHYMKWLTILDTLCQKSMLICVISDIIRGTQIPTC